MGFEGLRVWKVDGKVVYSGGVGMELVRGYDLKDRGVERGFEL